VDLRTGGLRREVQLINASRLTGRASLDKGWAPAWDRGCEDLPAAQVDWQSVDGSRRRLGWPRRRTHRWGALLAVPAYFISL